MQDNQTNCPYDDTDTDERYLAGTLSPSEADAFERHYFECDSCWARVQRGSEIKAAIAATPVVAIASARGPREASKRRRSLLWGAPLAAAAVLVLTFGRTLNYRINVDRIRPVSRIEDTAQVMRGSARNIAVSSHQNGSMLIAAWARTPSASTYRVRLLAPDGALLYERETPDTSVVLPSDSAGNSPNTAYWEIQALNELRGVIAVSPLTPTSTGARH
jgi:hypothetical protein